MKRSNLATALIEGVLSAAGPTQRVVDAPHRRPPGIRRYKAIERIDRTKQRDQKAKLDRRAERSARDEQLHARQKAKWG
jgi:hypothetical protein